MKLLFPIVAFFIAALTLSAQDTVPDMVTDRPDRTESALVVPHKRLQIESGFMFSWDTDDAIKTRNLVYNSTLLRYSILSRFEVRLAADYASLEKENRLIDESSFQQGFTPLVVGFKWNFLLGDGPVPTLAFLSHVDIPPAASEDFNDGAVMHSWRLAGSWVLSRLFNFGFNLGYLIYWEQNNFTPLYTASLGMTITRWMGAYVELYGFLPAGEFSDHRFDMGLTFPVRPNLQFDISGGMGISQNSPDGFVGLGISWRIPR